MKVLSPESSDRALPTRLSFRRSFGRSQVASLIATLCDFGTLIGLTELAHLYYVASTAVGAAVGGVVNFLLGRHWSFEASDQGRAHHQAFRYGVVSLGSLGLNSLGVYLLTDHGGLVYPLSKAITAVGVGVIYNFPLQRYFVFRRDSR